MDKRLLRVVVDTNVIIKAASSRSLTSSFFDDLLDQKFILYITTEILLEYEEKLEAIYDTETAELVISALLILPNVIRREIFYDMRLIRFDADDDKFVNCAFGANAHFIVSEDGHFKVLDKIDFPKIKVIKFLEFKKILKQYK